jgi:alpha-1,6-mannosyltransferase
MLRALGADNVVRQPLGVDTALFHPARRDRGLRRRLGLGPAVHLLVFAGRFAREKNIPQLVDAVAALGTGYHLLLIGAGRRCRPRPNVTVLPYQGEQLPQLLAACDALVHAGDQETFGLVVLEAMACGLPVVGVDDGAVAELIDPAVGVLARAARPAALATAIERLFTGDPQALGRRARARVERDYAWGATLRLLVSRYTALTGWTDPVIEEPSRAVG